MEAARRLDEWRVLSKKIPSTDMVPEFVVQENREGQINLNTSEWLILSKIDGHRSVKTIAAAAGLSVFDAAKILYGLIATGLIRLREPGRAAAARAGRGRAGGSRRPAPAPGLRRAGAARRGARPPAPRAARPRHRSAGSTACATSATALLGAVGESVVNKHYQKARAEIERGAGLEAIEEAIGQIARAASILKGPSHDRVAARAAQGDQVGDVARDGGSTPRAACSRAARRSPASPLSLAPWYAAPGCAGSLGRAAGRLALACVGRPLAGAPRWRRAAGARRPALPSPAARRDARLPRRSPWRTGSRRCCIPGAG